MDKTVQRMGGILRWPTPVGGLVAHIQLQRASGICRGRGTPKQRLHRPAVKRHLPGQRAQRELKGLKRPLKQTGLPKAHG